MPQRSNLSSVCDGGRRFFRPATSANSSIPFAECSGQELYRMLQSNDPNRDKDAEKYSQYENDPSDSRQQELRTELQDILQRAHEVSRALKQSAC